MEALGKKVVGISYDKDKEGLPKVILKGMGPIAERLEAKFRKKTTFYRVVQDQELLEKLFRIPMESEISPDLYELVAILLVHVYGIEARLKGEFN